MTVQLPPCAYPIKGTKPCGHRSIAFAAGMSRCAAHLPPADPNCSHRVNTAGRCSFCGNEAP